VGAVTCITLWEEQRLKMLENRVLRRIFELERVMELEEVAY
jgi:hypothetical protein